MLKEMCHYTQQFMAVISRLADILTSGILCIAYFAYFRGKYCHIDWFLFVICFHKRFFVIIEQFCANGNLKSQAVELCLRSGAKISTQQHDLSTAVHLACSQGSMDIVKLMFQVRL